MTMIEEKDNGKNIQIKRGESFQIELAENPSTGYTWLEELEPKNKILSLQKEEHKISTFSIGSTSLHTWIYAADQIGQKIIKFHYQRPWTQEPEKSFKVIVDIV